MNQIRTFGILLCALISLASVGCASVEKANVPDWDIAERVPRETGHPKDLPILCEFPWDTVECLEIFEDYEIIAEGNLAIARANTRALEAANEAYDSLISAGKQQQDYAALREEMLEIERREHQMDVWWYRGLIVLGGVAVIATR